MGYRDESEGLRARVVELEQELTEARGTIARLTGDVADVAVREESHSKLLGAPLQQELRRDLPFEVTDAGYEAIASMLRSRLGATADSRFASVMQVGSTLTYKSGVVEIVLSRGVGMSSLRLSGNHKGNAFLLGLVTLVGTFFGLLPAGMAAKAVGLDKANLIWIVPALCVATWATMRPLFRKRTLSERRDLVGVFESVAQLASQHQVKKRARVASSARLNATTHVEAEAEAAAEAEGVAAAMESTGPETTRSRAG